MSCTDKKAKAKKKKETEINQQIESVEKEAKEIEKALNELDNI